MKAHSCRVIALLGVLLVPAASWAAATTCLTGTAPEVASDPNQIAAVRAVIDSACPCASFDGTTGKTRGSYMACVNNVIKTQGLSSALRTKCKSTVKKYYTNSTCGLGSSQQRLPCIKKSSTTGKVTCRIAPADRCAGQQRTMSYTACSGFTTCIDAADTNHDLMIADGDNGSCASCTNGATSYNSTFEAIQKVIFEGRGCTNDSCHGSARSAGLDLRAGSSYVNLLEVPSLSSAHPRIQPGEPTESFLYLKLKAATLPGTVEVAGAPMPFGLTPLTEDQLEAVRLWIEAGAPQTGSVGVDGSSNHIAELLGACLPDASDITIKPLDPPLPGEGVQFVMPPYPLPAHKEREVCFAQYYDFSDQVPAQFKDASGDFMFINGSRMRQDANSHHMIINHSGLGPADVHDPAFGEWRCSGGARDGSICEPTDPGSCGSGLCGSQVRDRVACIGFGPVEGAVNVAGGGIAGAQTAQQYDPPRDGAYTKLPIRGIIYYNSHAFNLTSQDHLMHARVNFFFAADLQHEVQRIVDVHAIYIQAGQPPFTAQHYCADHTFEQGSVLLSLSSHTHKRGRNFTVTMPDGTQIYQSFAYSDPVDQDYNPPLRFDAANPALRTVRYCADYNNGLSADGTPDARLVTKLSTMPDRTTCSPVACAAGRIAASCSGANDDATCDSSAGAGDGQCDACSITAGVTTENEMFVLTGFYYLD